MRCLVMYDDYEIVVGIESDEGTRGQELLRVPLTPTKELHAVMTALNYGEFHDCPVYQVCRDFRLLLLQGSSTVPMGKTVRQTMGV